MKRLILTLAIMLIPFFCLAEDNTDDDITPNAITVPQVGDINQIPNELIVEKPAKSVTPKEKNPAKALPESKVSIKNPANPNKPLLDTSESDLKNPAKFLSAPSSKDEYFNSLKPETEDEYYSKLHTKTKSEYFDSISSQNEQEYLKKQHPPTKK